MTKAMRELLAKRAEATKAAHAVLAKGAAATSDEIAESRAKLQQVNVEIAELKAKEEADERAFSDRLAARRNGSTLRGDVHVLQPSDSVSNHWRGDMPSGMRAEDVSLGRLVRGIALGNWQDAGPEREFLAQQKTTPGSAGGYLVPSPLSERVIDLARNQTRVVQAGALTVPMDSKTLTIAKVVGDPAGAWKAEMAPGTFSSMQFDAVEFEAKTLMALVRLSVELFEDAANIGSIVEQALAAALAVELDRVALRGSGEGEEPRGILNTPGVQKMADVGAIDYAHFSRAVQSIEEVNGTPTAAIYAPRTGGELDRLVDNTGQPLRPLPSFERLAKYSTNQVPTDLGDGEDATEAYVGDFSQLMIGLRRGVTIEATRVGAATREGANVSAFQNLEVWIRAYLRADVQIAKPEHLVVMEGITPPTDD